MGLPAPASGRARRAPGGAPLRRRGGGRHHGSGSGARDQPPPAYYLPRGAFGDYLQPVQKTTFCEWKGTARYVDVVVPGAPPLREVGWWYPAPDRRYPELVDRVAVYVGPFDEVTLDGETVAPQPGGFYGGWVTAEVVGPFKGGPGSWGW